jgi:phosphoserine aminotransferase
MTRPYSFSAGATMLPACVRERLREGLDDWQGTGLSILEASQRGAAFEQLVARVLTRLRALLVVPASHAVLLVPGSSSQQFAMVPLNLLRGRRRAAYVVTGTWSLRAAQEARRWCDVQCAAATAAERRVPRQQELDVDHDAAYLHYTANETIDGVEFPYVPACDGPPLVGDWSSALFTRPLDASRFGVVYAGAQKHLGAAGLTVVIVREDLVGAARAGTPTVLDYAVHVGAGSLHATSVGMAWYVTDLMLEWIEAQGGVDALARAAERKAELVYAALDASPLYVNKVQPASRSRTTIPFALRDPGLLPRFVEQAAASGLVGLEGHASVGGLRAGLSIALPLEGARQLAGFLDDFARRHG